MYALRWTLFSLALCLSLSAQTGVKISPHSPTGLADAKAAVRRYCEMDAQGFRLSHDTAQRMQSVTMAKTVREWNGFQVISEFQITSAKLNARGALITVSYSVLGRFDGGDGYMPDRRDETVDIQAIADGDQWKVKNDDLGAPYVLRMHALKWLREQAATEKDPDKKRALLQAIGELS
jgi:hypothetical protein